MSLRWTKRFVPKGGWEYEEPSTGKVFHGLVKATVGKAITDHRIALGIPVGDPIRDMEELVCKKLPGECIEENSQTGLPVKRGFTADDVKSFANSVAHVFKNGGVVDMQTATDRARICKECKMNVHISGCLGCSGVQQLVFNVIGAKETIYNDSLENCGCCGCSLKAKIWITKENLEEIQSVKAATAIYPDHCWMKK